MSESEHESDSPVSQFSSGDEIIWTHGDSLDLHDNTDFVVLHHPLPDTHSLPSTLSQPSSHDDLSAAVDSLREHTTSPPHSPSISAESEWGSNTDSDLGKVRKKRRILPHSNTSASFEYYSGTSTPIASYDDASAFISRFLSSPVEERKAELDLLHALIIELGLRSPNASGLPCTLTSARKVLKAEAHINIKDYVATRHKGQLAIRGILKPSKSALRKDIRKGNVAPLKWVKQQGLQVLLLHCFT